MSTSQGHQVLSAYRQLLRLIRAQPDPQRAAQGLREARETVRARRGEANPEAALAHYKELAARISFLRVTTPRQPGTPLGATTYVWRDGQLVEGEGEDKGARVAASATSMADAKRLNAEHYARFYGKPKAKDMMF